MSTGSSPSLLTAYAYPVTRFETASAISDSKAAVKAAATAGKASEESPADRDALRQLAEKSAGLEPAARAYARRLAVEVQLRLKVWQPLGRLFGVKHDYFESQFEDDMASRLSNVPEEDLVEPRGSIAGPAIQGLGFTLEEPELRAMYLSLLATASDKRVAEAADPSFAEVIRQLSAEEARVLPQVLSDRQWHPIIEIRRKARPPASGYHRLNTHVLNWMALDTATDAAPGEVAAPERALFVENWLRLGLVTVDYQMQMTDATHYEWVDTAPLVVMARQEHDDEVERIHCGLGVLAVTDFGRAFARAVIANTGAEQLEPAPAPHH